MFDFLDITKNMVQEFLCGFSVATGSSIIIHSVSKNVLFSQCMWYYHYKSYAIKNRTLLLWQLIWHRISWLPPFDVMKREHSCIHHAYKVHSDTNHTFQKYVFELLVYSIKIISFGCFKACITLNLSNYFLNLLFLT